MNKILRFAIEFEDLGPSRIAYEVTSPPIERAATAIEEQLPALYVNKAACKVFAEVFAKLAVGSYSEGFHVHLYEDFDDSRKEMLRISLTNERTGN